MPNAISVQRLFLFTIVIKVTVSLIGWWIGSPWILGFIVPLAVMGSYVWIGLYRRDPDEVSDEKFADSCYYLGFIFTISSIIVSFLDLPSLNQGGKLADIAVRFAAAMVSTVIGLVVRVYLVNFRKDLSDITKAMEDDLLDAERAFRTHLGFAIDNLKALNYAVNDAAKDVVARVEISITETAQANTDEFTRLFDRVGEQIGNTANHSAANITASSAELQKAMQLYVTSIMTSTKHHEEKLTAFTDKLGTKLDSFSSSFAISLASLSEKIDHFAKDLNKRLNGVEFPAQLFAEQLTPPIMELKGTLSTVAGELAQFAADIDKGATNLVDSLNAVPESVRETTENIRKAVNEQRKSIEDANAQEQALLKLARNIKHFETALARSSAGLDEQHAAVTSLTGTVAAIVTDHASLREFASQQSAAIGAMSMQIQRLCETIDAIAAKIQTVPEQNRELAQVIGNASLGQVGAISNGFTDLSTEITRSLETVVTETQKGHRALYDQLALIRQGQSALIQNPPTVSELRPVEAR